MIIDRLQNMISLPVPARPSALLGFDGFIDTVGRLSHGDGASFESMAALGRFLVERRENNCSMDVIRTARKIGGNMPICANALAGLGVPVDGVGAVGQGAVEAVFAGVHALCTLHPAALPGECLALEFLDSKLFLADASGPRSMSWENVVEAVGQDALLELAEKASLLGFFNWGEIPNVQRIWERFAVDILPGLSGRPRQAVFDLADCSGRSSESILSVLKTIEAYRAHAEVTLSANDNEILALARALGYGGGDPFEAGHTVYRSGAADRIVHHALSYARVFEAAGAQTVDGIHIDHPVLVTGGGDHFNAGLCLGLLAGCGGAECALLGNTVSRLYVSTGASPTAADVLAELSGKDALLQKEEGK